MACRRWPCCRCQCEKTSIAIMFISLHYSTLIMLISILASVPIPVSISRSILTRICMLRPIAVWQGTTTTTTTTTRWRWRCRCPRGGASCAHASCTTSTRCSRGMPRVYLACIILSFIIILLLLFWKKGMSGWARLGHARAPPAALAICHVYISCILYYYYYYIIIILEKRHVWLGAPGSCTTSTRCSRGMPRVYLTCIISLS